MRKITYSLANLTVSVASEPIGFEITGRVNRGDLGVSWNDELPGGGLVISNWIDLSIDVEAILDDDLRTVGLEEVVYPAS